MKNLLNLNGSQQLSKDEQKAITGGKALAAYKCGCDGPAPQGYCCCSTDRCRYEFIPTPPPPANNCW